MTLFATETTTMLNDLNTQFQTESREDIEAFLNQVFKDAFTQADSSAKKKKLYFDLSLLMHPDREKVGFVKTLDKRGFGQLPFQVLSTVYNKIIEKEVAEKSVTMASYNPWLYIKTYISHQCRRFLYLE